jgi:hypothetical protein
LFDIKNNFSAFCFCAIFINFAALNELPLILACSTISKVVSDIELDIDLDLVLELEWILGWQKGSNTNREKKKETGKSTIPLIKFKLSSCFFSSLI